MNAAADGDEEAAAISHLLSRTNEEDDDFPVGADNGDAPDAAANSGMKPAVRLENKVPMLLMAPIQPSATMLPTPPRTPSPRKPPNMLNGMLLILLIPPPELLSVSAEVDTPAKEVPNARLKAAGSGLILGFNPR